MVVIPKSASLAVRIQKIVFFVLAYFASEDIGGGKLRSGMYL
jgi:hypothetical protein